MQDLGFITVIPALVVFVLAIWMRRSIESLLCGTILGLAILHGPNLLGEFTATTIRVLTDEDLAWIILVCGFMGSMISLQLRAGGFAGFSVFLRRRIRSARGALMGTWVFGLLLFVDDYMNSLAAGTAMRDLTDDHGVPREKLAYVVDSTAAPVSVIIPFSTWSAFFIGLLVTSGLAVEGEGFSVYLSAVPYMFYAWIAVLMVPAVALGLVPSLGPMKAADRRVASGGETVPPGVGHMRGINSGAEPGPQPKPRMSLFIIPMLVLVLSTFWFDKDFLQGIYFTVAGLLVALIGFRILDFNEAFDTVLEGFGSMLEPLAVLVAAYLFKDVNDALGLPAYVVAVIEPLVTAELLPVTIFVSMAAVSFMTGSSWGVFVLVMPIVATLTQSLGADPALVIGATISASTFGSHACFYSDATVLTAKATGCTPLQHALTQFPYALLAAGLAVVGYLLLAFH